MSIPVYLFDFVSYCLLTPPRTFNRECVWLVMPNVWLFAFASFVYFFDCDKFIVIFSSNVCGALRICYKTQNNFRDKKIKEIFHAMEMRKYGSGKIIQVAFLMTQNKLDLFELFEICL